MESYSLTKTRFRCYKTNDVVVLKSNYYISKPDDIRAHHQLFLVWVLVGFLALVGIVMLYTLTSSSFLIFRCQIKVVGSGFLFLVCMYMYADVNRVVRWLLVMTMVHFATCYFSAKQILKLYREMQIQRDNNLYVVTRTE